MLQISVKNNLRIRGLTSASPLKLAIIDALTIPNPEYEDRKKKRKSTWGIPPKLELFTYDLGDIVTGRGFLPELKQLLIQKLPQLPAIEEQYTEGLPADFGEWIGPPLRDYQRPAVAAILDTNGVLVSPAGSGKTLMGMYYIWSKGRFTVWLTHTSDLMRQAKANAEKYLGGVGEVGIIGEGVTNWGSGKLVICMAQTLAKNPDLVETLSKIAGTLVIDEAHHFPAPLFQEVANRFAAKNFVGLTATPDRKDQLERFLYVGIGPKLYEVPRTALNKAGQLIIPEVRFIYTSFRDDPASQINEYTGAVDAGGEDLDYQALVDKVIHDQDRLELVARTVLDNAAGNYSLVLTESVRYCFYIRDKIIDLCRQKGIPAPRMAVVHGGITRYLWRTVRNERKAIQRVQEGSAVEYRFNDRKDRWEVRIEQYTEAEAEAWRCTPTMRKEAIQAMREKKLDILLATQLAREGLDIPHLNIEHMTMSKRGDTATNRRDGSAVEQEAGRIQRPDPGNPNKKAILFDYVDYNVGVFRDQYYSRRAVYKRLGFQVPKKPRTITDTMDAFLGGMVFQ